VQDGLSSIQKPLAILFSSSTTCDISSYYYCYFYYFYHLSGETKRKSSGADLYLALIFPPFISTHNHPHPPTHTTPRHNQRHGLAPALALPTPIPDNAAAAALPPLLPNNTSAPRVDVSILDGNNSANNGTMQPLPPLLMQPLPLMPRPAAMTNKIIMLLGMGG
jgi:hypothetical protein